MYTLFHLSSGSAILVHFSQAEWRKQEEKAKAYEHERRVSLKRAKEVRKTETAASSTGTMSGSMLDRMRELSRGSAMVAPAPAAGQVHTPPGQRSNRSVNWNIARVSAIEDIPILTC